jgi:hypothetical protein
MKDPMSKYPTAAFNVPAYMPEPAADAYQRFDGFADAYGSKRGEITDAEQAVTDLKAEKARAIAAATAAGDDVAKVQTTYSAKIEKAVAHVAELREQLEGLAVVLDEAGNEWARAAEEHRSEWIDNLSEAAVVLEQRYRKALEDARAALRAYAPLRRSVEWIEAFDANEARVGRVQGFTGGRLTVEHKFTGSMVTTHDPDELLIAAAKILDQAPAPTRTVRHVLAVASSRFGDAV